MKKSPFFDFFNRRDTDFDAFFAASTEGEHYIDWNDFVLPADYGDAEAEYQAIRNSCAMFDVSPIRKYRIRGAAAGTFFDALLTRPVSSAPSMRGIYVVFCNDDGSLKDDSILYKYADDDYLLMPSDMDHSVYFESLRQQRGIAADDLSIVDCSDEWVGVALQGPSSATVLRAMGFESVEQLKPFEVRDYPLAGDTLRIARMGFTADLGYECWFAPGSCGAFEQAIDTVRKELGYDIPGYGLGALEVCRLEGGFIVAGWDFSTEADPTPGFDRTPFDVGLGWLVDLAAENFVGREALKKIKEQGQRYVLRSLQIDGQCQLEDGAALVAEIDGQERQVGSVNCSAWSWGLEKTLGNASIELAYADLTEVSMQVGAVRRNVVLGRGPVLNLERRNQVPAHIEQ
ncbi:MAG: aminomethyltransferase family protein [Halioglobus sp.]